MAGRDPRLRPVVGDVLTDEIGKLHVVGINKQPGVANVTYWRQPTGMSRHEGYELHIALSKWRIKTVRCEIETAVM